MRTAPVPEDSLRAKFSGLEIACQDARLDCIRYSLARQLGPYIDPVWSGVILISAGPQQIKLAKLFYYKKKNKALSCSSMLKVLDT